MALNILVNFTNTYIKEDYPGFEFVDCSDISGTDMYLDDEAHKEIKDRLKGAAKAYAVEASAADDKSSVKTYEGIHLIDSGNYHHMSRVFTEDIDEPYELVFFDNHTDMKPAMFDMLSCGSWAKEVLEKDDKLVRMVMIGPPQKSVDELDEEIRNNSKLLIFSGEALAEVGKTLNLAALDYNAATKVNGEKLPVYISVDKDVLSTHEVMTNWDQGEMSLETLLNMIREICTDRKVLGADICGLLPASSGEAESLKASEAGKITDLKIIEELKKYV
jgi:arginase family enzyme